MKVLTVRKKDLENIDSLTLNHFIQVPADDEFSLHEDDEDLSKALQTIQEQTEDAHILVRIL